MQNLPSKRDPKTTYKLERLSLGQNQEPLYGVAFFGTVVYLPTIYRFDILPQWMQDAVATLDTAGAGVDVVGIGRKVGNTYWIGSADWLEASART